jgi:hypothetical protein
MTSACKATYALRITAKDNGEINRGPKSRIIALTMCKRVQANILRSDRYEFVVGRVESGLQHANAGLLLLKRPAVDPSDTPDGCDCRRACRLRESRLRR